MDNGRGKGGPKEFLKPKEEIGLKRRCGLGKRCSLKRKWAQGNDGAPGEDVIWEEGGLGEMMGPREKICL
jgi:hypothetical protein